MNSMGGAYFEKSNLNISNSNFIDNSKNAIYAYDSNLNIEKSNFKDNTEAIYGVLLKCKLNETNLNNDTLNLNHTDYPTLIMKNKTEITLINDSIDVVIIPKRFDSREWGWTSSVKNQIEDGACWSFGTIAALESALLKSTGIEYDFSENNIKNTMLKYSRYGILGDIESGFVRHATENILSWLGPVLEEYDTYDDLSKVSPINLTGTNIHVQDVIFVGPRKNLTDNDEIKKAIMKCGSLAIEYYSTEESPDYNSKTNAQYQDLSNEPSHAVTVVGWDDNFPKKNFLNTPPGDGAWIIKDNFGVESGDKGYLYLSYYDVSFLNKTYAIGFIFENTENYTKNYQRDLSGEISFINNTNGKNVSYKITYQSIDNDLISAVGTYFKNEGESYTLNIYINNQLKHTQNGIAPYFGFHTVKLTKEIPIYNQDNFTVEMIKKTAPILEESRQRYETNTTFVNSGDGWEDLGLDNKTTSLKVYTKDLDIFTQDLVKIYKNESQFNAFISQANKTVTFEINGMVYNRTSDADGKASLTINLNPGSYTIKTIFNGISVENNIEVLPTLIADNLVKYFRNESQFDIKLIDGFEKPVSGVNIIMNINGVFYERTTNENGTARLNINLEPGEYILTATDPLTGLQMAYTITVLAVLTAEDLEMTYKDGSQFKAKLVDSVGNALANVGITFNINGLFYTRTTNSSGIAALNINLMAGEYIITSQYDKAVIGNKITIRG